jgi:hypothetical protein
VAPRARAAAPHALGAPGGWCATCRSRRSTAR